MTVGFGITPNLLSPPKRALAGLNKNLFFTAGRDFHPALRTFLQ
jgi:hypothetical protein